MSAFHESRPDGARPLRIVCIVSFLNEERHLQTFLDSIEAQQRTPDELLLVDDGSKDQSPRIAADFADGHQDTRFLQRPRRPLVRDRLADGAVVRAFQWALSQVAESWDVAVKMDADLELSPDLFATIERAFQMQPDLGIAGTYLSIVDPDTGERRRERCPPHHARGPTKFYRRACYQQIAPLPAMLGWDTIDEIAARRFGWRTASVPCPAGDTTHLRPTGAHDGLLRAQFRWGKCAYAIGQHPGWVTASAIRRLSARPRVLASVTFMVGWIAGFIQRWPRAPAELRAYGRNEQVRELRRIGLALPGGTKTVRRAIQTAGAHDH